MYCDSNPGMGSFDSTRSEEGVVHELAELSINALELLLR